HHLVQVRGEQRAVPGDPRADRRVRRRDQDLERGVSDEAQKDRSQRRQKAMLGDYFARLARARETGHKVVYTFVPGNLTELRPACALIPVLPEVDALQSGMRQRSRAYLREAEKHGHSEDVCTYVKCDGGMRRSGNIGPTGERIPDPDLLLLSYTG